MVDARLQRGRPQGRGLLGGAELFVFVEPNATPPSGITIQELAEIARAALTVPQGKIKLNPDASSYVNLPTFVWLEGIGQPRRTVTATLPGVMSATVVATLRRHQDQGGHGPGRGGRERVRRVGQPYAKDAEFTCGVRYQRASDRPAAPGLRADRDDVWPVAVTGGAENVQFDPVQAQVTRDVPVGEVQSNVKP